MELLKKFKNKVKGYVNEVTEEPVETLVVIIGVGLILSKIIPTRCNHHLYLHILDK